jgi:tetratricopeptide (TPR) repeat protein
VSMPLYSRFRVINLVIALICPGFLNAGNVSLLDQGASLMVELDSIERHSRSVKKELVKKNGKLYREALTNNEKMMAAYNLGLYYIDSDPKLAFQYLSQADTLAPRNKVFYKEIKYAIAKAKYNMGEIEESIRDLKTLLYHRLNRTLKRRTFEQILMGAKDFHC